MECAGNCFEPPQWKCWQWETFSLRAIFTFSSRFNRSVYFHLLFRCPYFRYLVLVFVFKFNCSLGNRYFLRCMIEHTKRQVHKWKFLQHALYHYVYNRSLFDIFTQVEMTQRIRVCHICFRCPFCSMRRRGYIPPVTVWRPCMSTINNK